VKAIVQHRYGPPDELELEEVETPRAGDGNVLVRVRAASVNPYDWHQATGLPYIARVGNGLRQPKPRVLGLDLAGEVVSVGSGVTAYRPGDEVHGVWAGAFAEYVSTPPDRIAHKPANLSFEQAAAAPLAGVTALQALRDRGRVRPGQRVLIVGGSGGVGTFAIQIAKAYGAHVTAVCSTRNVDLAGLLGADDVIDYTRTDFVQCGQRFDLILDIAGNRSVAQKRRVLDPAGTLVVVGGPKTNRWVGPAAPLVAVSLVDPFVRQRLTGMMTKSTVDDLIELSDLLARGVVEPIIEDGYPLAEVPKALRRLGEGHLQGKLAITV
jgi:NADPH:quinone reductase-like Zn-dependent oxidoreductase